MQAVKEFFFVFHTFLGACGAIVISIVVIVFCIGFYLKCSELHQQHVRQVNLKHTLKKLKQDGDK